jgi:hypothetical protein
MFHRTVIWRGHRFRIGAGSRLTALDDFEPAVEPA